MNINLFISITVVFCLTTGIIIGVALMRNNKIAELKNKLLEERKDNLRLEKEKKWLLEELAKLTKE